jgi:GNAT superfamily N-acetyltransferase
MDSDKIFTSAERLKAARQEMADQSPSKFMEAWLVTKAEYVKQFGYMDEESGEEALAADLIPLEDPLGEPNCVEIMLDFYYDCDLLRYNDDRGVGRLAVLFSDGIMRSAYLDKAFRGKGITDKAFEKGFEAGIFTASLAMTPSAASVVHRLLVRRAVKLGLPVSPEVLSDYPNLAIDVSGADRETG